MSRALYCRGRGKLFWQEGGRSCDIGSGIQVNRIINEPSAAALASYFDTDMEQVFLVFDFGGGTLDIIIETNPKTSAQGRILLLLCLVLFQSLPFQWHPSELQIELNLRLYSFQKQKIPDHPCFLQ